ncbi:MAG: NTF2-like N-terminal transpeptidase domain-containing protein [Thermoleophilia bacterium]
MNQTQRIRAFLPVTAIIMLLVAVLALTAVGCGGNSPGSAAGDMVQLLSERRFGDAYDSFSSNSPVRAQVSRDDFVTQMSASLPEGTAITDFSVTEENIEADKGTISWKATVRMPNADDQTLDDKFQMVKEEDNWKVDQ